MCKRAHTHHTTPLNRTFQNMCALCNMSSLVAPFGRTKPLSLCFATGYIKTKALSGMMQSELNVSVRKDATRTTLTCPKCTHSIPSEHVFTSST